MPNVAPRDDIRIRDAAPVIRPLVGEGGPDPDAAALAQLPWSWAGPRGKPVFNFRAEGRRFAPASRVLIPADGFYEFTAPADPKAKRKDKWLFTIPADGVFAIAGVVRDGAFAMLTVAPGPDVVPIHDRQIVVLRRDAWRPWLTAAAPEAELLRPSPAGTFQVEQVAAAA